MKATLESDNDWRATLHVDEDAKNLITAPACRSACMELVLQALLGFKDYERFMALVKKYPIPSPGYLFAPSKSAYSTLMGIQLVVDL